MTNLAHSVIVNFAIDIIIKTLFPSLALLARPCTSLIPACAILTLVRVDYSNCAEIRSGLSKHPVTKG